MDLHHPNLLHGSQQEGWYSTPMLANCTLMIASVGHATMWSIIEAGLHLHLLLADLQGYQTWDSITRYLVAFHLLDSVTDKLWKRFVAMQPV